MDYPRADDKRRLYNRYADTYRKRTDEYGTFLSEEYQRFRESLPQNTPEVLDIGCGPGRDAEQLQQRGIQVTGLDLSERMLEHCRQRGIQTIHQNIEDLNLPDNSFDGVWTYTSLTTIPKEKVWTLLNEKLPKIINSKGVLFLGLIEGEGEHWKPADKKYDLPRFISRWQKQEVLDGLNPSWQLKHFSTIPISSSGRNTYLHFLLELTA